MSGGFAEPEEPRAGRAVRTRIVIPAYRADATLGRCLAALCADVDFSTTEIVVVDDGGNEQLDEFKACYPIDIIRGATSTGAAAARNRGASPDVDILVFIDADVVVEPGAVARLIQPIIDDRAAATVGNYTDDVQGMNFAQQYKQLYISRVYRRRSGYILNQFWTALGAIRNDVFHQVGGFRTVSGGAAGEDTELGQRLSLDGKRIFAVPEASGRHLKPYSVPAIFANDFRKGVKEIQLTLTNRTQLTDHRHATQLDIAAVVLAWTAVFLAAVGGVLVPRLAGWLTGAAVVAYAIARRDMLAVYTTLGPVSLLKSFFMLFGLDLVRGISVVYGATALLFHPLLPEGTNNEAAANHGLSYPGREAPHGAERTDARVPPDVRHESV